MGCFLCKIPSTESPVWYDSVLDRNQSAFVVPSVGSIGTGHVLVSPIKHVHAVQGLERTQRTDFIRLLGSTCTRVANEVGAITAFEHSAPGAPDIRRSACVDHAHVHIVPGRYDLSADPQLVDKTYTDSLPDFYDGAAPYDGYMMFTNSDGSVTAARDVGRPQYIRQKIFQALGKPDEWDYALFPNEENMRQTIAMFTNEQ